MDKSNQIELKRNFDATETRSEHYNKLCNTILSYHPSVIVASSSIIPIVVFSDKFVEKGNIPLTGVYKYGELDGVDVIIDNRIENNIFYIIPQTPENKPMEPLWIKLK